RETDQIKQKCPKASPLDGCMDWFPLFSQIRESLPIAGKQHFRHACKAANSPHVHRQSPQTTTQQGKESRNHNPTAGDRKRTKEEQYNWNGTRKKKHTHTQTACRNRDSKIAEEEGRHQTVKLSDTDLFQSHHDLALDHFFGVRRTRNGHSTLGSR